MHKDERIDVAPDSVRVWRGFMAGQYRTGEGGAAKFRQALSEVFIPMTAQAMAPVGLTAYQPTILVDDDCPSLPDEIALVFYESRETYASATKTTLGKAYGMLHGNVFNFARDNPATPWSTSAFPEKLIDRPALDTTYHLFDGAVDWYHGDTEVYVGVWLRPGEAAVRDRLYEALMALRAAGPAGLDGLVLVDAAQYLIIWAHGSGLPLSESGLPAALGDGLRTVMCRPARHLAIPDSMWAPLQALDIGVNDPVNTRFQRRTSPD